MNIHEIESMTEQQIKDMAIESIDVKGHTVYFADLGEYFGYSAMVCAEGMHIYHADDFELHHSGKTREELRKWYLSAMNNKLFTEDELRQTSEEFDELTRKRHYLHNYYSMRRDYISIFHIGERDPEEEAEIQRRRFSRVGFAYYADTDFVERMDELEAALEAANDPLRDYEHAKNAFKHEMFNHEYAINWQGDWDVISCFCKVKYDGGAEGFHGGELEQAPWSDEIKQAYRDAAHEVMVAYANNPY